MSTNDRHSYVELFPSDWKGGTAGLEPLEEWCYLQICLYNWDHYENVPANKIKLILRRCDSWEEQLETLVELGKVQKTRGGGYFVARAMAAARRAYELWSKRVSGGKKTAKKNKGKQKDKKDSSSSAGANGNDNGNDNGNSPNGDTPKSPIDGDLIFSPPEPAWSHFVEMREEMKEPFTAHARKLAIGKLEKLQNDGEDAAAVLEQSIMNGWKGLFPAKGDEGNGRSKSGDGFRDALDEAGGD